MWLGVFSFVFCLSETATPECYTGCVVGSVICVEETGPGPGPDQAQRAAEEQMRRHVEMPDMLGVLGCARMVRKGMHVIPLNGPTLTHDDCSLCRLVQRSKIHKALEREAADRQVAGD